MEIRSPEDLYTIESILGRLKAGEPVICLDEYGSQFDSPKLADRLDRYFKCGKSTICFIIGSPLGLADEVKQRADLVLSLSSLASAWGRTSRTT